MIKRLEAMAASEWAEVYEHREFLLSVIEELKKRDNMAYLFHPHIQEVTVSVSLTRAHDSGTLNETYTFIAERDGIELTNQVADTVISALHLATAVMRERNANLPPRT